MAHLLQRAFEQSYLSGYHSSSFSSSGSPSRDGVDRDGPLPLQPSSLNVTPAHLGGFVGTGTCSSGVIPPAYAARIAALAAKDADALVALLDLVAGLDAAATDMCTREWVLAMKFEPLLFAPEEFPVNVAFVAQYHSCLVELANMLRDGRVDTPKCAGAAWYVKRTHARTHARTHTHTNCRHIILTNTHPPPPPLTPPLRRALHSTAQRALRAPSAYPHTTAAAKDTSQHASDSYKTYAVCAQEVLERLESDILAPAGYKFEDLRDIDARLAQDARLGAKRTLSPRAWDQPMPAKENDSDRNISWFPEPMVNAPPSPWARSSKARKSVYFR